MIIAGEISGDMHAAALLREMRRLYPGQIEAYGIGGDHLAAEGMELYAHVDETGVMGFWEVARRFRFLGRLLKETKNLLDSRRPDLLLTVDYPGFNMRIAPQAKARGIRTVQFISPQVWIWNRKRIPKMVATFDCLIPILPFEPAVFDGTGLKAVYVGNPLVDQVAAIRDEPRSDLPWGEGRRVALFAGSRKTEIQRILPGLVAAARLVEQRVGPCSFILPSPSKATAALVREMLAKLPDKPAHIVPVEGESRQVLLQAEAAVVKSGTGTLEASLLLCPSVIVYRVATVSYYIMKYVISGINHVGLVNIVADREVCRELLQHDFTPQNLADELEKLLTDEPTRTRMLADMREVNAALGEEGVAARAAALVLEELPPTLAAGEA